MCSLSPQRACVLETEGPDVPRHLCSSWRREEEVLCKVRFSGGDGKEERDQHEDEEDSLNDPQTKRELIAPCRPK